VQQQRTWAAASLDPPPGMQPVPTLAHPLVLLQLPRAGGCYGNGRAGAAGVHHHSPSPCTSKQRASLDLPPHVLLQLSGVMAAMDEQMHRYRGGHTCSMAFNRAMVNKVGLRLRLCLLAFPLVLADAGLSGGTVARLCSHTLATL